MSDQLAFLGNLIATAREGDEGVVALLRQVCQAAVERAPVDSLITIGNCLYRLGQRGEE